MARRIPSGKRRGFTFVELMVVITIMVILITMAIPIYNKTIIRSKESVLRTNLFTLRTVIDNYTYDKMKAPQTLQDLVSEGYLRSVPVDPMTGKSDWGLRAVQDDPDSDSWGGHNVFDVYSQSQAISSDGKTKYSEW